MKNKLMVIFESAGLLTDENKEIISYGLTRFCDLVTSLLFAIVCAGLMGDFFVGIFFEVVYMSLRSFAGGYHADTKRKCLFLTYVTTFSCIILIFIVPINRPVMSIMMILFDGIIYYYAPVQSENKPLDSIERRIYRKKSIQIAMMETGLYVFLTWIDLDLYSKAIFFSMSVIVAGMVIGLLTAYRKGGPGKGK